MFTDNAPAFRVRHEAGEALGAIGTPACLKELQQYQEDPCLEVSLTYTMQTSTICPRRQLSCNRYLSDRVRLLHHLCVTRTQIAALQVGSSARAVNTCLACLERLKHLT